MLKLKKVKYIVIIFFSQRHNNTTLKNDSKSFLKRPKTASNSAQTENKSYFLKLTIPQREGK